MAHGSDLIQHGPRRGIEVAVQCEGEPGQLCGVRQHLALVQEDLANAVLGRVALRLQAVEPLGFVRLSGLEHQGSEPADGFGVSGVVANQELQFTLLGLPIPLTLGQPGPYRVEVGLCHFPGWVVDGGLPEKRDIVFGQGKVQRRLPDRRVLRQALLAQAQPASTLGETPCNQGMPRSAQPDAVILAIGLLQCCPP